MKKYINPTIEYIDIRSIRPMMAFDGTGTGSGQGGSGSSPDGAPKRKVF